MNRTVIIGAGIGGLSRGYALARRGEEVLLLEATDRPGGVIRSERRDGFLIEKGPNTVRPTPELWALVRELGLEREVQLADARTPRYIEFSGGLHRLPMSPGEFVRTRLLSPGGKLRVFAEPFLSRGDPDQESVSEFFRRRLGPEVAERFVEPFVGGIFAAQASELSLAAAFPTLARWETVHGSLLRGAVHDRRTAQTSRPKPPRGLLSFRGGLEALARALATSLGERLQTGTRIEEIAPSHRGWRIRSSRGDKKAERLVLATPAGEAARLVRAFAAEAADALSAIPHPALAVLHLAWSLDAIGRNLTGFGHLVIPQPERRILGAVWSSSLFPDRAPEGQALFTVFLGGSRSPETAALGDQELVPIAAHDLGTTLGIRQEPRVVSITRYASSIPQYVAGHLGRMRVLEEAEAKWPGICFLGNYRGGIAVGDVVRNALAL